MSLPRKNWLEWTVFAIGVLLVLTTIGLLVWDSARTAGGPADVTVDVGAARAGAQRHFIPVTVRNQGDGAAEGVQVEVVLEREGAELERATLVIPFLPRGAQRNGWVSFGVAPLETDRVTVRALGFERP
jgi:uncharacterized protein (TIGR02588 family)